jgi:Ser/Thr protein kinase RdoA (MazF antagonist)
MPTIWQELTHETIFGAVEAATGAQLSNLLRQRNSYINRVYELEEHDSHTRLIAKFYRPGRWTDAMILEEHAFLHELAAKDVPVIPPLEINGQTLFHAGTFPYSLFPKKGGRALDEFDRTGWETIGRLLARIHQVGATRTASSRITWRPAVATRHHLEVLNQSEYILPDFRPAFNQAAEAFIAQADPLFEQAEYLLIHGDLHKGNLIHRPGEGIFVIDFDDICLGPPVQDIWMLLPGGVEQSKNELTWLLKGYKTFRSFDRNSLPLIPALRGMRLIHFAAWQAVQSKEPDFNRHFPEAGNARYWNELVRELHGLL